MKLLFLRGEVPQDRDPKEIKYATLDANDDMWEQLACALGDEHTDIYYWGGCYAAQYSDKDFVRWAKTPNHIKPSVAPDVVFARGGFDEWNTVVRRFPNAIKVYYGAGKRYYPKAKEAYDIVLVDDERQLERVRDKGMNGVLWQKPAAPMFKPINIPKEYDICYVADGRFPSRAKRKGIRWVYETLPSNLSVLQLGWSGKYKPPKNVIVKRVLRSDMPQEYARCRIGIAPYTKDDSAPRSIPEMLACGLNVVALDSVNMSHQNDGILVTDTYGFWEAVRVAMASRAVAYDGFADAVKHLRGVIEDAR